MAPDYVVIKKGMRFWYDGQVFTCLSINECSATVQCQATKVVTITNADGTERTFTARSGRTLHLAARATVEELDQ